MCSSLRPPTSHAPRRLDSSLPSNFGPRNPPTNMPEIYPAYGPYTAVAGLLFLVLFSVARWVISTLRPQNFPPGPPVIPGLGNLLQIPPRKPYLKFHAWSKQYGDLFSLKTGAGNLVVINNPAIVHELFDKRGAIYSNRPVSHVLTKYIWYGPEDKSAAIMQYGSKMDT